MRVKSFPEKLAKWECVDTQDPWLGKNVKFGSEIINESVKQILNCYWDIKILGRISNLWQI